MVKVKNGLKKNLKLFLLIFSSFQSQMLFMGGVLEAYEKLIGHMLKELPTPSPLPATSGDKADPSGPSTAEPSAAGDTRSNLIKVLQKIRELKKHSYQEQVKILHELQKLKHIEVRKRFFTWF